MKRIVFTFGTLYEESLVEALLGYVPEHFLATLNGYSIYQGNQQILSEELKQDLASKGRDLSTFKFLFAKKDNEEASEIEGKAYHISISDELMFDWWERYPKWYRKEDVLIQNQTGETFEAFIYTVDKHAEKIEQLRRDPNNNIEQAITNARKLRDKVKQEFPIYK